MQDFDFSLDLLFLHGLEDLDDALIIVDNVYALKDLIHASITSDDTRERKRHTSEYFPRPTFLTIS